MKFINLFPDLPNPKFSLEENLQQQHEFYCNRFQHWSLAATRKKIIVSYWLKIFLEHFSVIVLIPSLLLVIAGFGKSPEPVLVSLLPVSVICFMILFTTMYFPHFYTEFLPHLDSCIEYYKIRDKLRDQAPECKRQQYSVVTLMLIQQTYQQMAGLGTSLINSENAKLLARQYGVSDKSIVNAMQLIVQCKWDRKSIRKRTEIINDFEAAKEHFEKLSHPETLALLDQLQLKILSGT